VHCFVRFVRTLRAAVKRAATTRAFVGPGGGLYATEKSIDLAINYDRI
jgi:hypothetical protein